MEGETVFDGIRFCQLHISRQVSAAKGFMGACPQVRMIRPG